MISFRPWLSYKGWKSRYQNFAVSRSLWIGSPLYSNKFGLYTKKEDKTIWFNAKRYNSVEEAFAAVKSQLDSIITSVEEFKGNNDWNELSDKIDLPKNPMNSLVVAKILALYYPDLFVSICSRNKMNVILNLKLIQKVDSNILVM